LTLKLVNTLVYHTHLHILGAYDAHEGIGPSPITAPQVVVPDESTAGISSGGSGRAKW
jgi:hypothetical protein